MKYRSIFLGHHLFHSFEVIKHVCRSHNIYLPITISITCPTFYIHCPPFCPTFNVYLPSTISIMCPTVYIHHATFPIYRITHLFVSNTIHQRTISSLPQARWHITMTHILVHLSQQLLLWYKCRFPPSFTFPSGHF